MSATTNGTSRRDFLRGTAFAGGGLLLGLSFGERLRAMVVTPGERPAANVELGSFLRVTPEGRVVVLAKHDEMGQGIHTCLAITVCEELEIDVADVDVVPAPADPAYAHSTYGIQVTGGSTSTWTSFDQIRQAGAIAREMLIEAAARRWRIDTEDCIARDGAVHRKDGSESLRYGELAAAAAELDVPQDVPLKTREQFTKIGKSTKRVDSEAKVHGRARFSLDTRVPGMLTAVVLRCPHFGGSLRTFDGSRAATMPGVRKIVEVPSGVAIVADSYWSAFRARDLVDVEWDAGRMAAELDTERLRADYRKRLDEPGLTGHQSGPAIASALDAAEQRLDAVYEVPFQPHAPMEPLSCLVTLREDGGADLVTGSQMLGGDHPAAAARLGVTPDKVTIENSYLGGGFGRRANPKSDFTLEAIEVALAAKDLGAPIKTVWSREDDLRGGWYRPMFLNRMTAGIAGDAVTAWRHRICGQSIAAGTAFEALMVRDGVDGTSVEGAADMPYSFPRVSVELHTVELPVPVQWWRSVGHSNTAFAKECFLDEVAHATNRDPYEFRRRLLQEHPRLLAVLERAAKESGWGQPLPNGVGRGIAVHESFKGFAAHVVEASVEGGQPKIHRIVAAIDCGPVINPDQVVSQFEGASIFALSATTHSGLTLKEGAVEQSNFHDFQLVRMHEAPKVEVHLVDTGGAMGGIGEVGVPSIAPAVCNAIFDACGVRIRRLPVGDQLAG